MFTYIKQFGATLLGSFALGITLTWLSGIPWRFVMTIAVFLFILKILIEQKKSHGAVIDAFKEFALFMVGLVMFVGLRASAGYFLDIQISQTYNDVFSASPNLARDIVFEFLFLGPGVAIAYLVLKKGAFWRGTMVAVSTLLLACLIWSIKQRPHSEAMKRQTQSRISLDARVRNNRALLNEAAAATSFGIAKEPIVVFYQWDAALSNMVKNLTMTNRVLRSGEQVLQLHPNEPALIYQGLAFAEVILKNPDGSFLSGTKAWVEARQFTWVDGGTTALPSAKTEAVSFTVNKDEVISTLSVPNNSTIYMEADKAFCILEKYGTNDDGSEKLSKLTIHPGQSNRHFTWGGRLRVVGLYDNTIIKLHL